LAALILSAQNQGLVFFKAFDEFFSSSKKKADFEASLEPKQRLFAPDRKIPILTFYLV